jgi:predicted RNase H-like nuclease (RuvC/YqgF family)
VTDQGTLKNIINEQRETIKRLTESCEGLAKGLQETIDTAAEIIKDYQSELEQAIKTIRLHEQFDRDYDAQISENNRLKTELGKTQKEIDLCSETISDLIEKKQSAESLNIYYDEKLEAADKKLDELIREWENAYSLEANELQSIAIDDLKKVKAILSQEPTEVKK